MINKLLGAFQALSQPLFNDPAARRAYGDYDLQLRIRRLKVGSLMIVVMEPLGYNLDHTMYPDHAAYFFELRLWCAFMAAAVLVLAFLPSIRKIQRPLGILLPLLPNFFTAWMIYATQGGHSPYYAGIMQVLMAVALVMPWTAWETALVSALSTLFYVQACRWNGPLDSGGVFSNNMSFLIYTEVIIVIGSYLTHNWRARQFALSFELERNRRLLEDSNRKLVELDQMKSRFFANISHELRTPLTLLIAPLEALQSQKGHLLDPESRDILQTMTQNAMRLLKLINDLLDLVKLESGRIEVKKEPFRPEEFIKGLGQAVLNTAKDKRVQLSTRVEGLPPVLQADRDKLEKILLNLLFNALKFTPAGGRVELLAEREGAQLRLKVTDTGMGIAENNLPHIFDRFWQADSAANRKYQGVGIGLALVKELTEVQGGTVGVESQVGRGTTMTVRVPFEEAQESDLVEAQSPAAASDGEETGEWLAKLYRRAELFSPLTPLSETLRMDDYGRSRKPKLLVADDEPDMLRFLKSQLEKHYQVVEAVDGNQALEKARQFLPDLILLDMMMPEMDGVTACRELKAQTSTQGIPVVLLTARADEETKLAALNAGASDFLTKPFSTTELHVRVKNLVDSHKFQRDLARQKTALESALEQVKETEGQLVQSEKMASLGRLSAGIIHEINNPLNYAAQALYLLKTKKDKMPEEDRAKYVEIVSDIEEGVGRVQRIVSDLRTFTHPGGKAGQEEVDLEGVVAAALRFLSHELKDGVQLKVEIPAGERVKADKNKLIHIFVNLFQNSLDALKEKKGDNPSLKVQSRREKGKTLISVWDNGSGISGEDLPKVFDPFFTTKDVGEGMGLGLSICYRMVAEQGGAISVKSEKGKFTEFTLELPSEDRAG
jgi:signal transduction histidine kinase